MLLSARQGAESSAKSISAVEMENFISYLSAISLSVLVVDRDYWNIAVHEESNQNNMV